MNPSLEELNNKLSELDTIAGVSGHDIEASIRQIRNPGNKEEPCSEWKYEIMAFAFRENCTDENEIWGTYRNFVRIISRTVYGVSNIKM